MTISSTTRIAGPFIGNGTASAFPVAFKVFTAGDIDVVRLNTSTGVESTLVLTTDYTVTLNIDQDSNPGGTVTLVAGPLATGFTLTITSDIANLQPTDLTNQGGFYPEVITDSFDRATIQIQQMSQDVGRSLKGPISDGILNMELPTASQRANSFLAFDANGLPTTVVSGSSGAPTTITRQVFSGTGSQMAFTLASDPGALGNSAQVYIGGVYQQRNTYTIAGTTLTFSQAPVAGTDNIEFVNFLTSNIGATSADLVTYTPSGTSAVARSAASKFGEIISVKDFGAVGDGVANDSAAFAAAVAASATGTILVPSGTYRIGTNLTIPRTHGLWFSVSGIMSIDSGVTLAINGSVDAPDAQIFDGAGLATGITFADVGRIHVRWFGAKGDGVTDDSTEIQAAVNTARRSDRATVFFGSGIFAVGTSITLAGPANAITIMGTDMSGLQTGSTNSNTVILWTGGASPVFDVGFSSQVTFCNFYDLSFQNAGTGTAAIQFSNNSAGNVRIGRISTTTKSGQSDFSSASLILQGLNYSVIDQVQLLGSSVAIIIDTPTGGGTISVIQDSVFSYGSNVTAQQFDPIIKLTSPYGSGYVIEQLLIQNCTFNVKNGRRVIDNTDGDGANNITFRSCEFNGTPAPVIYPNVSGVKIAHLHDFQQLLIEDCYISQMGNVSGTTELVYAYTRDQATPYLPFDQTNIVIRNNTLVSNGDASFVVTDGYVRPNNVRNGSCPQYYVDVGYNNPRIGGTGPFLASATATSAQYIPLALISTLWSVRLHLAPVNVNSVFVLSATANPASATTISIGLPADSAAFRGGPTRGQQFAVRVVNTSGGSLTNISFGAQFKMPAVTMPADGNSRTWHFVWDGTNAIEINRTAADVPN